ncbi:MAG: hypothetical protein JO371_02935, partial [Paraburkholderia sp.]|nr:hypothetical protein [Paraburkholderia sp.]
FQESFEITRDEYRNAPAWKQVAMHVARLFSPVL